MSTEPELQPSAAPLQFDRAVHADPSAAPTLACSRCKNPIVQSYYHDGDRTLCAGCGKVRQHMATPDRSAGAFLRAIMFGFGGAVGGALVYYAVMAYLGLEIGIVAIAIGLFVGRAVAKATGGRSARRHQILAVGLTYLSIAMAYAPLAVKEWKQAEKADKVTVDSLVAALPGTTVVDSTTADATPAASKEATGASARPSVAFAILMVGGILLALPIAAALGSMPGGLITILIIGFGLHQAWKAAVAANRVVTGPHAIGGEAAA
jgi:F0F1-type ATP synthase assembly protein I